jgi:hypothetical protein
LKSAAAIEELARPLSPLQKLSLSMEVVVAYLRIRWTLARGKGVPETIEMLRATAPPPERALGDDRAEKVAGIRLGRAVGKTLGVLPTDARCLIRSLVLLSLLAQRGIASSVVIGVKSEPEFGAHAWVESGGTALLPPSEGEFSRLVEI